MHTKLKSVRMPSALATQLEALASEESTRRGEAVSFGTLLREGARLRLKLAERRGSRGHSHLHG
jgi:hypothetical protein